MGVEMADDRNQFQKDNMMPFTVSVDIGSFSDGVGKISESAVSLEKAVSGLALVVDSLNFTASKIESIMKGGGSVGLTSAVDGTDKGVTVSGVTASVRGNFPNGDVRVPRAQQVSAIEEKAADERTTKDRAAKEEARRGNGVWANMFPSEVAASAPMQARIDSTAAMGSSGDPTELSGFARKAANAGLVEYKLNPATGRHETMFTSAANRMGLSGSVDLSNKEQVQKMAAAMVVPASTTTAQAKQALMDKAEQFGLGDLLSGQGLNLMSNLPTMLSGLGSVTPGAAGASITAAGASLAMPLAAAAIAGALANQTVRGVADMGKTGMLQGGTGADALGQGGLIGFQSKLLGMNPLLGDEGGKMVEAAYGRGFKGTQAQQAVGFGVNANMMANMTAAESMELFDSQVRVSKRSVNELTTELMGLQIAAKGSAMSASDFRKSYYQTKERVQAGVFTTEESAGALASTDIANQKMGFSPAYRENYTNQISDPFSIGYMASGVSPFDVEGPEKLAKFWGGRILKQFPWIKGMKTREQIEKYLSTNRQESWRVMLWFRAMKLADSPKDMVTFLVNSQGGMAKQFDQTTHEIDVGEAEGQMQSSATQGSINSFFNKGGANLIAGGIGGPAVGAIAQAGYTAFFGNETASKTSKAYKEAVKEKELALSNSGASGVVVDVQFKGLAEKILSAMVNYANIKDETDAGVANRNIFGW
jgi:hypothetical protein